MITSSTLYDGNGSAPLSDVAVLIDDGLIAYVGPRSGLAADLNPGARIEAPAGAVIPGLIDAHVHTTSPAAMVANLAHGVTTVRYAGMATSAVDEMREALAVRGQVGPRILDSGPMIDTGSPAYPQWAEVAATPGDARTLARRLAGSGRYDALYPVQQITPDLLEPIVAVANEHDLPVAGQLWATDGEEAARLGVDQVDNNSRIFVSRDWPAGRLGAFRSMAERLSNMAYAWSSVDWEATTRMMDAMIEANVAYCPTFVVWEDSFDDPSPAREALAGRALELDPVAQQGWDEARRRNNRSRPPDEFAARRAALEPRIEWVGRFHQRGGRITVGTDMEFGALYLGRELVFLRRAGFSVAEAIAAATGASAKALGRSASQIGTIEPGKVADLVVVSGDPARDPDAPMNIEAVIVGGKVYSESNSPTLGSPST
jgi:imidazolonepropionase-like amidohydrolase